MFLVGSVEFAEVLVDAAEVRVYLIEAPVELVKLLVHVGLESRDFSLIQQNADEYREDDEYSGPVVKQVDPPVHRW